MSLEISGKILKFLPEVSGSGKNGSSWTKQEVIIETQEQYPKKVCVSVWGDKIADIKKVALGDEVKLSLSLESREYNERWYTEARAWRVDAGGTDTSTKKSGNTAAAKTPAPTFSGDAYNYSEKDIPASNESDDDDLPF